MSPWALTRLDEVGGDISKFSVVRVIPSEQRRHCVAKTEPGDENNQDISSLVGKVDIRRLEHFSQDDADARIEVTIAEAALEESRARLELANDVARRQQQLTARGTGAEARAVQRTLQAAIAKASVNQAGARLAAAQLSLARTKIRAPIDGTVGRLRVARGAFVEAEGGTVVLELVQLDPVLVSYAVPYEARQQAMINAGTRNVPELLQRLRLSIRLPGGKIYPSSGNSLFESARIEPGTKTLRVWGEFPNAGRILVPGLEVGVISRLAGNAKPGAE